MKLVADINIPYLKGVLEPYFEEVIYLPGNQINRGVVETADVLLVRTRTNCNEDLLKGTKVKFIGSATIGFDHIDNNFCDNNCIVWSTAPGCNSGGVLQWFVCALLQLSSNKDFQIKEKVLGVVGVGNVGSKIAKAGAALGMHVLCCDPPRKRNENLPEFVDFKTITKNADIITFHVPLSYNGNDATFHMANDDFYSAIKPKTIIFNSSRGEVIDTAGLIREIKSGKVLASAMDVWENEPKVSSETIKFIDISTPHIAGYSLEGKVNGTKMVVDSLSKFFKLGIDPWSPNPNPVDVRILHDSSLDLRSTVSKTYDILKDHNTFRNNSEDFEKLRNEYNFRREFSAYDLINTDNSLIQVYKDLGFGISNQ